MRNQHPPSRHHHRPRPSDDDLDAPDPQIPPRVHHHRSGLAQAGDSFLYHTLGVRPRASPHSHNHAHHGVPDDMVLSYNKKQGRFFLVRKGDEEKTLKDRRKLWKKKRIGLCSPKIRLYENFGEGIYLYFDFIRFTTATNAFLTILMLINIVPHFTNDGFKLSWSPRTFFSNFYVSSYGSDSSDFWFWSVIVSSFATFCFGPALSIRIKHQFKYVFHHHDHEDQFEHTDLDLIKDDAGNPKNEKGKNVGRLILSYFLFGVFLLISTFISGAINLAQLTIETDSYIFSIVFAAFLTVSNLLWQNMCEWLTNLEGHYTWTTYRKHQTVKFYAWKIINLSTVFLTRFLVRVYFPWMVANIPFYGSYASENIDLKSGSCSLAADAETFLIFVISEFTVVRVAAVLAPWLKYKLWSMCNKDKADKFSDAGRPEFDVAAEYLELLYRQFLLYLAIPVCPIIAPLSFLGNFLEYPIDQWVLLNLTKTPPILRGSMRSFLVFFMFITALLGLVSFPQGTAWVLAGFNYGQHCPGTIFTSRNLTAYSTHIEPALNQNISITGVSLPLVPTG